MNIVNVLDSKDVIKFKPKCTSHGNKYGLYKYVKIGVTSNSECFRADFWPVRRLGCLEI